MFPKSSVYTNSKEHCCVPKRIFFFTENEILVSLMFVYFEYHRCPAEHYVTMEMFYIILCNTQPLNLCG